MRDISQPTVTTHKEKARGIPKNTMRKTIDVRTAPSTDQKKRRLLNDAH